MPTTVSNASQLIEAVASASSGDVVQLEPGTYNISGEWNIRSEGITIEPVSGRPHVKFAADQSPAPDESGIKVDGANTTVRGLEISGSGWKGIYASQADGCTFEDLDVHHCNVWGIMNNGSRNVTFRNCDSHDNFDPQNGGQNSDGFNMAGPARNGLIEGCRAWNNGDDGYDMWNSEGHTIRNCWSWNNGLGENGNGNGFKLGAGSQSGEGGGHSVYNCVSFDNNVDNASYSPGSGFWWNGEDDRAIEVQNCTAWGNGIDFAFADTNHVLRNNISVENNVNIGGQVVEENNTWNLDITEPTLRSTDPGSDDFARLPAGSPCIGAGIDGGDLGAFEFVGQEKGSSSGPITIEESTTLAAADAKTTSAALQQEHDGFNGSGYLNFVENEGASVRWPVEVSAAGVYNFTIRYANGGSSERTTTLRVGDTQQELAFDQTEGWAEWSRLTGTVELPSGGTDIAIETTGDDGGNIDQITIEPAEDDGSSDKGSEQRSGDTPNHGYHIPEAGQSEWHVPLNENFAAIDRDVPVVDTEGSKTDYEAANGTLYIALDTGTVYVGDGSEWNSLGTLN